MVACSRVGLGSLSESSERLAIRRPPRALDRLMSPFMVTGVVRLIERAGLWDGGGQLGRVDLWVVRAGRRALSLVPVPVAGSRHAALPWNRWDSGLALLGCCP